MYVLLLLCFCMRQCIVKVGLCPRPTPHVFTVKENHDKFIVSRGNDFIWRLLNVKKLLILRGTTTINLVMVFIFYTKRLFKTILIVYFSPKVLTSWYRKNVISSVSLVNSFNDRHHGNRYKLYLPTDVSVWRDLSADYSNGLHIDNIVVSVWFFFILLWRRGYPEEAHKTIFYICIFNLWLLSIPISILSFGNFA
jgi:hypothetical protein